MAGRTVTQIVATFRTSTFYPSCGATEAERLFGDALREVSTRIRLRQKTTYVSLTDGTAEYDLSEDALLIREAYYEPSSDKTEWKKLKATSIDQLSETTVHRTEEDAEPEYWYVTTASDSDSAKLRIGFYPTPDETTGATYPRVAIYGTEYADLTTSETVPGFLLNDNVFLYRMAFYWSLKHDSERTAMWEALWEKEIASNTRLIENKPQELPATRLSNPLVTGQSRPV